MFYVKYLSIEISGTIPIRLLLIESSLKIVRWPKYTDEMESAQSHLNTRNIYIISAYRDQCTKKIQFTILLENIN